MLIVSQNGKCMTEDLNIHIKSYNQKIDEVIYAIENDEFILGYYKTEERAKEVFEEIIQYFYNTEILKCKSDFFNIDDLNRLQENAFVYEMPKE